MPSIDWNRRTWGDPANWTHSGDEWTFHALSCSRPYDEWKRSVVETFIDPYLGPEIDMLEVGPGFGRWTEFMIGRVRSLTLVDVSPTCIKECEDRFSDSRTCMNLLVNDGSSLPIDDESVDVIWSFASFVHVDEPEIDAYLGEFRRVLRPGGKFFVHHAGWLAGTPVLAPASEHLGGLGKRVLRIIAQGSRRDRMERAAMSAGRFKKLAEGHGLRVEQQLRRWGPHDEYGLAVRDIISLGRRVSSECDLVVTDAFKRP